MTGENCSIRSWTGDARKKRHTPDLALVLCVVLFAVEKFSTGRESWSSRSRSGDSHSDGGCIHIGTHDRSCGPVARQGTDGYQIHSGARFGHMHSYLICSVWKGSPASHLWPCVYDSCRAAVTSYRGNKEYETFLFFSGIMLTVSFPLLKCVYCGYWAFSSPSSSWLGLGS